MLKHKLNRVAARLGCLAAALFFAVTSFSCKSTPTPEPVDILNLVDCTAPFIIYIPCNTNQEFVKYAMIKMANMKEGDAKTIAGRSNYIAISTNAGGDFQIAIDGSYPSFGIKKALAPSKGWTQSLSTETTIPMPFYASGELGLQIASPVSSLLMAGQTVSPMLKRYENEQHRLLLAAEGIEDSISENMMDPVIYDFLLDNKNSEIRFYSQNPSSFLSTFLGKVVSLGLSNISGVLIPSKIDKTFDVKLDMELSSSSVTKAAIKMLKIALFPIPLKIVQTGPSHIQIVELSLTYNQLLAMIKQ